MIISITYIKHFCGSNPISTMYMKMHPPCQETFADGPLCTKTSDSDHLIKMINHSSPAKLVLALHLIVSQRKDNFPP